MCGRAETDARPGQEAGHPAGRQAGEEGTGVTRYEDSRQNVLNYCP